MSEDSSCVYINYSGFQLAFRFFLITDYIFVISVSAPKPSFILFLTVFFLQKNLSWLHFGLLAVNQDVYSGKTYCPSFDKKLEVFQKAGKNCHEYHQEITHAKKACNKPNGFYPGFWMTSVNYISLVFAQRRQARLGLAQDYVKKFGLAWLGVWAVFPSLFIALPFMCRHTA